MGRPPWNERYCNCPREIQTCCCSRKLPKSFIFEMTNLNDCDCLRKYLEIAEADITGNIPETIRFCINYNSARERWEGEIDLTKICCNKRWCVWFYCKQTGTVPCGLSYPPGSVCIEDFSCANMQLRMTCKDVCIDDNVSCDDDAFDDAFQFSPDCCNCSCSPCASIGWMFSVILGGVCSCGSVGGVSVNILCIEEISNFPFECPSREAENCCCVCTPTSLTVCLDGDTECTCIGPQDPALSGPCTTLVQANRSCEPDRCDEFCMRGSIALPGSCGATFQLAICCSFFAGSLIFLGNNCDPNADDLCTEFNNHGDAIGCERPIDVENFCVTVGGSCCEGAGPDTLCFSITE